MSTEAAPKTLPISFVEVTKHNIGQVRIYKPLSIYGDRPHIFCRSRAHTLVDLVCYCFASVQIRVLNNALIPVPYSDAFYKSLIEMWPIDNPLVQMGTHY